MTTITLPRAVVEQALEALELGHDIAKAEADRYHVAMAGFRPERHTQMDAEVQQIAAAITALRAALAQQAEPAQEPAFHGFMSDDGTQVDVCFSPSAPRRDGTYATAYYTAPLQRKPLTEKEMYAVEEEARKNFRLSQKGPRGQQITYWDGLTPWLIRAVERAHGIKE